MLCVLQYTQMILICMFDLYGDVFFLGWVGGVGDGVQRGTVNKIRSLKPTPLQTSLSQTAWRRSSRSICAICTG